MKVDNVRIIVFIKIDKMMFYENLVFFFEIIMKILLVVILVKM